MAKVRNNIFVRGLNGDLGRQFYVATSKVTGRTTVSARMDFGKDREPSEAQKAHQLAFREAIFYAQSMKGEEIYRIKADGTGKSPYNLAMADWFHAPEILGVDLSGWNGDIGQVIRVRAQDDVKVTEVRIQISNGTGATLEAGQALEAGALWWEYTSMQHFTGDLTVTVSAKDLPGHSTQASEQKTVSM